MGLPVYKGFTEEQIKQFGPAKQEFEALTTERHVYISPFMYGNLDVGNFYEIGVDKGIEFKADDGFITVKEDKPIEAVNVVGTGCVPFGYNIVEWWDDGEDVDSMKSQLVKRQRIDNLHGTHPSIWSLILLGKAPQYQFGDITGEQMDLVQFLKRFSENFYGGYYFGLYENTASFRIGPPYPKKVTVRCGCKATEDPTTTIDRYPGDYAIRVVETIVVTNQRAEQCP